jgi:hypothetical protein
MTGICIRTGSLLPGQAIWLLVQNIARRQWRRSHQSSCCSTTLCHACRHLSVPMAAMLSGEGEPVCTQAGIPATFQQQRQQQQQLRGVGGWRALHSHECCSGGLANIGAAAVHAVPATAARRAFIGGFKVSQLAVWARGWLCGPNPVSCACRSVLQ